MAKHGAERMSDQLVAQLGGTALSTALSQNPSATTNLFQQAVGIGTQVGCSSSAAARKARPTTWA
ncbi:MAG: hypothetical protein WKG07_00900 [Hymenobacter sp.]